MPFPPPKIGIGILVLGLVVGYLYVYYLHPAWRKERRVIRACERAFDDGNYRLVRVHVRPDEPSIGRVLGRVLRLSKAPRYFTYYVQAEEEPDVSGMSRRDVRMVRRYLRRGTGEFLPHYGRTLLRPEEGAVPSRGDRQEEKDGRGKA